MSTLPKSMEELVILTDCGRDRGRVEVGAVHFERDTKGIKVDEDSRVMGVVGAKAVILCKFGGGVWKVITEAQRCG